MRWSLALGFTLVFLALMTVPTPSFAWAQAPNASTAPATGADTAGVATVVGVVVAFLVIIGAGVKLYDLKRKREAEAVLLQSQLSDALLREPGFSGLPVTATVHMATFKKSPPIVEISGQVPTKEARERALTVVRAETFRVRPDAQFEDRIAIVPVMAP